MRLRPFPHPGLALFAAVLILFGYIAWNMPLVRPFAFVFFAVSAYLLAKFLYGLKLERSLPREGLVAQGRVTRVEEQRGGKGRPDQWWIVHFEMTDASGGRHALTFEEVESLQWREGGTVMIRYHPVAPDRIYRVVR